MSGLATVPYLLLALLVRGSTQVCAPECTGVDSGTFVRDPTNCTRYYVCIDIGGGLIPSDEPVDCAGGQYFNDGLPEPQCDPISDAPAGFCSNLCNPCEPHCTAPGQVTPHPQDCSIYYVCLDDGTLLEVGCEPPLPYFDFLTEECTGDEFSCYGYCDPCEPHCTVEGEQVADPVDCHRFYVCSPPDLASFTCPHDEVYDAEAGECVAGGECLIDCGTPGNEVP